MLVDHADAQANGVGGRLDAHGLAVEQDRPGVGLIETVQDLHQRGLAGAVLAQQRMHFAGADVEIDVVVGQHAGKALDDAVHDQPIARWEVWRHRWKTRLIFGLSVFVWIKIHTKTLRREVKTERLSVALLRRHDRAVHDALAAASTAALISSIFSAGTVASGL